MWAIAYKVVRSTTKPSFWISRPVVLLEEVREEDAVLVVAVEGDGVVAEVVVLEVVGTITMMTATEMPEEEADVAEPPEDEGLRGQLLPHDEEEVVGRLRLRLHRHLLLLHEIVN